MQEARLIQALAGHIGETLTPETAARILAFAVGGEPVSPAQFPAMFCGRLAFRAVSLREKRAQLAALNLLQAEEMPGHEGLDFDELARREARGGLLQFVAQDGTQLVGQIRAYLFTAKTGESWAQEESVFLARPYRAGRNLVRFGPYVERCLRSIGVQRIRMEVPFQYGLPRLAEMHGYQPDKTVLVKRLEN